jgi:hypothetical protein
MATRIGRDRLAGEAVDAVVGVAGFAARLLGDAGAVPCVVERVGVAEIRGSGAGAARCRPLPRDSSADS